MAQGYETMISPAERRRFIRVRAELPLSYEIEDEDDKGGALASRDISAGGVQFAAHEPLLPGTKLILLVGLGASAAKLRLRVTVVWSRYSGASERHEIGAVFRGLDDLQRENVLALIGTDLPTTDGAENRRFIRLRRQLDIAYAEIDEGERTWRPAVTHDLSLGGFAMACEDTLEPGARVALRLFVYGRQETPLEADGEVLHSRPGAREEERRVCGKFSHMQPETFDRLATYISERVMAPPIGPFT
jgi:c-di-GMP-binding flagellar brake protein YcgR